MSHRILRFTLGLLALHVGGLSGAAKAETTLHRGNGSEIESLDPAKQETIAGLHVVLDAFEGLTDVGPDGDVTGRVADNGQDPKNSSATEPVG